MCTGWKAAQAHLRREGQSQDSNPETIFFSGFCWAFLVLLFILNIKGPFCCLLTFCNFTFRNVSLVTAFSEVHLSFQYLSLIVCLSFKIMYMNCKESEPIDCLSNWHQSVNLKFSGMFPFSIWVRIVFYVSFHEIYLTFPQKLLNCLVNAVVICVHFRKFFFPLPPRVPLSSSLPTSHQLQCFFHFRLAGHMVSVTNGQMCCHSTKAARSNM